MLLLLCINFVLTPIKLLTVLIKHKLSHNVPSQLTQSSIPFFIKFHFKGKFF